MNDQQRIPVVTRRNALFGLWNLFDLRAACFFSYFSFGGCMGVGHGQGSCLLKTSFLSLGCFTTCSFRARPMKIFEFRSRGLKGQKQTLPPFLEHVKKWKFHHHFPLGYFVTLPTFQKCCLLSILIHFLLPYPVPSISRTPAQKSVGFQEYSY